MLEYGNEYRTLRGTCWGRGRNNCATVRRVHGTRVYRGVNRYNGPYRLYRVDTGLFPLRCCCGRQCYGSGRALAESYYRQTLSLLFWWLVIRRLRAFPLFRKRMLMGEPS